MSNPFEPINARLTNLEALTLEVLQYLRSGKTNAATIDADPYGDFKWLQSTCSGVPTSTLRIKSAAGQIPGVVKFGKRVLYDKAVVLNWLRSQTLEAIDMAKIEESADLQISSQLNNRQKGGRKAA
ncbi:hypothetical protein GCM10028805_25970 [Spirosoma harenae]